MTGIKTHGDTLCFLSVAFRSIATERAQAALEFLLILPVFMTFMFFLIDFGILTYHYVSVANAVREGARYGATNCGDGFCNVDKIRTRVMARSGNLLSVPAEINVRWVNRDGLGGSSDRGDSVVVSVNHPYPFVFVPGATFPVVSCADMRLEQADRTTGLTAGSGC